VFNHGEDGRLCSAGVHLAGPGTKPKESRNEDGEERFECGTQTG
jgi:hypothetical protein